MCVPNSRSSRAERAPRSGRQLHGLTDGGRDRGHGWRLPSSIPDSEFPTPIQRPPTTSPLWSLLSPLLADRWVLSHRAPLGRDSVWFPFVPVASGSLMALFFRRRRRSPSGAPADHIAERGLSTVSCCRAPGPRLPSPDLSRSTVATGS